MKKFFAILGIIFLVLIVAVGGFVGYSAYQGSALDASSKAYVEASVPPILSIQTPEELLKRSSPQLRKALSADQLTQIFDHISKAGALRSFDNVKGESMVGLTTQSGKTIGATYTGSAKFENGNATVSVRLIQLEGQWQFLVFGVDFE